MVYSRRSFLFGLALIWITLIPVGGYAQLQADFEADTLQFCPPRSVKFNDLSTGGRIISRRWEFGQGGTSNNNNPFPSASYIRSGKYSVKLVISDGVNTDSITKTGYITAHNIPIADFTTSNTPRGCKPLSVGFVDNTRLGDAPIQQYDWNFGDGNRSQTRNPNYRYGSDGKYTVVYTVTDTNGCYSSNKKQAYVDVLAGPKAKFNTSNPSNSCKAPHKVNFVNLTTGMQPIRYSWDFGNGNGSNASAPSETFNQGVYTVQLIATDSAGCKDTLRRVRYVSVGSAKADFETSTDTFCLTDTNSIRFTNKSIGGNTYNWDFGDGTTSQLKHPTHKYAATGRYQVKLHISSGPGCTAQITKTIDAIQPKIDFTTDVNYWCNDTAVTFTPSSDYQKSVSSLWWFRSYATDTVKTGFSPSKFTKSQVGWHTDTLFAFFNKWGTCKDSVIKRSIRIWKPTGNTSSNPPQGCAPLKVTYSHNLGPQDSLMNGVWDIGGQITAANTVTKTYYTAGIYGATYKVKHVRGCQYTYNAGVQVGDKPKADFKVAKKEYCANEKVKFINLSTDSNVINKYLWSTDMSQGVFSFERHVEQHYADTGFKSAFLVVSHNGCSDTIIKKNFIKILGPTGSFGVIANCDSVFNVEMAPFFWTDYHRFKYDFGDYYGVDSTDTTAKYQYVSRGNYNVQLSLFNDSNNCEVKVMREVKVRDIKLSSVLNKKKACFPDEFEFNTRNSQDVDYGRILIYGVDTTINRFKQFKIESQFKGVQRPMLIGYDVNGCADTNRLWLKTYLPEAKIVASVDSGCAPLSVQFSDSSDIDTTITYRRWFLAHHGRSAIQHPSQLWKRPGKHKVILKMVDAMGCYGEDDHIINAITPSPEIRAKQKLCIGEPVIFSNPLIQPKETLSWSFGNGQTGAGDSSSTSYASPGKKTVSLRVTDSLGCDSTVVKQHFIEVQEVNRPLVAAMPNDTNCYPAEITYRITQVDTSIGYYYWRFDSTEAYIKRSVPNAFYTYDKPGAFGFDLKVETTFGCKDSFRFSNMATVGGPYARFNAEDTFCLGATTEIKLTESKDVYKFQWDFGDGIIDTIDGDSSSIFHKYTNTGVFPISLIFSDSLGDCVKSFSDTVAIQSVGAEIMLKDSAGCTAFDLQADASKQPVDRYNWFINGKFIGSEKELSYEMAEVGVHRIHLQTLNTITTCSAIDSTTFEVFPLPVLTATGGGIYCYGDSAVAYVSGAEQYVWSPNDYLSSDTLDTVKLAPNDNMVYSILGIDKNGCESKTQLDYKVVRAPTLSNIEDTTLYLGEKMQLDQPFNEAWSYEWKPPLFLSCFQCPNPELEANRNITYTVSVTDKYGCFTIDSSFSVFVEDEYSFIIPNAFSPNADGLNDVFRFYTKGIEELVFFGIYSRWGELLYEFDSIDDGWDGTYRGRPWKTNSKLVYKGQLKKYTGELVDVGGFIVLVR